LEENMKSKEAIKQFIVDDHGKKKAVILPIDEYNELLEDLHDLAVVAERRDESILSHDEVYKKLKNNGLI
jgi:inorganic pyrophosphatase